MVLQQWMHLFCDNCKFIRIFMLMKKILFLKPAWLAFFASLLLSIIALSFEVTIGTDAATYLDAARIFHDAGARVALAYYDWPWFSILIGWVHGFSGLTLESIGYFFCVLLLAGFCALLVDVIVQRIPGSAGWALLVVLALPALNIQRGEIMREPGFWFFSMLTFWLALRWHERRGGWGQAILMQATVLLAAMFRLEAVILMPALMIWQALHIKKQVDGWLRLMQVSLLPVLVAVLGVIGLLTRDLLLLDRVNYYVYAITPRSLFAEFFSYSQQFAASMPSKFAMGDSGKILFAGFMFVQVWKFTKLLGPFFVPFLFREGWVALREYWLRFQPLVLSFALYFLVLIVFFLKKLHVYGRYVGFLNLLAVPLLVIATMALAKRFPRAVKALVAVSVVVMLANVISLSAKKTHYIEAGAWLAQQVEQAKATHYFDDGRIAWYAGWGYQPSRNRLSRTEAMSDAQLGNFHYYAIEARADEPWLLDWLTRHPDWRILAQFANAKQATIVILGTCSDTPAAQVCQQP